MCVCVYVLHVYACKSFIALLIGEASETLIPGVLAIAAGGFLYIAGSDLVPELHKTNNIKQSLQQILAILVGVGIMLLLLYI